MFFDLHVILPTPALPKEYSPSQIAAIDARIDILVHLGYTVLALTQTVHEKIDLRTHTNWLTTLLPRLKPRPRTILLLKRLSLHLSSPTPNPNLTAQTTPLLHTYDILAIHPSSPPAFSHACLTTSIPSPTTTHIIALPLTLPRLPFHLKHTLVRTALKNGAVFELAYAGAVASEADRRNWWGAAREVVRVTKGKGILLSGGTSDIKELRAPRDAANLITLLGIPQNLSHSAITQTPKTTLLRAQSRTTYRAILSAPKLVLPSPHPSDAEDAADAEASGQHTDDADMNVDAQAAHPDAEAEREHQPSSTPSQPQSQSQSVAAEAQGTDKPAETTATGAEPGTPVTGAAVQVQKQKQTPEQQKQAQAQQGASKGKKRRREEREKEGAQRPSQLQSQSQPSQQGQSRKKRRKK